MVPKLLGLAILSLQLMGGGWLGILVQDLTPQLARRHGVSLREGVYVARVEFNSPAEKGGLEEGDVIVAINKHPLPDAKALQEVISEISPGTRIQMDIIRGRRRESLEIALGSSPSGAA